MGFIAALISVLGCGTVVKSRETTPWLRTSVQCRYEPLAVLDRSADSGGWRERTVLERRDGSGWVSVRGARLEAIVLDRDRGVIMPRAARGTESAYRLLTRDGGDVPIWCGEANAASELRLSPRGEIACIEIESPNDIARARVVAYDARGRVVRRRATRLPIATTARRRAYTSFVGFLGRDVVFVQQIGRDDAGFEPSLVDPCTALALDRRGKWRRLGTIPAGFDAARRCIDASVWSALLHADVERGTELRSIAQPPCP